MSDQPSSKPADEQRSTKVNLFIAGAAKCGTTAWHRYLRTHPDIFFPELKEPNYFAFDFPRMRNFTSLEEYENLFARGRTSKYRGEASGLYLYSAEAARAIHEYNPAARILIFLREQEKFLPSYHHQLMYRFAEPIEDFEEAWRCSGDRPPGSVPKTCPEPALLDYAARGDFLKQVERFFAAFPREQILVIDFADWTSNPRGTYLEILDFLGLPDDGRTDFPAVNEAKSYRIKWLGKLIAHPPRWAHSAVGVLRKLTGKSALGIGERASNLIAERGYRTQISPELRERIKRHYHGDNRALAALIGKPWGGIHEASAEGQSPSR